jgi:HlyD family secretion protein
MKMPKWMRNKTVWIASAIVVMAGGYYAQSKSRDPASATPVGATVYTVRRSSLLESAAASGKVEPHVQVEVKSRASGEIIDVLVAEGDRVEVGTVLFRLDPADAHRAIDEARALARRSSAELAQARANLTIAEFEAEDAHTTREVRAEGTQLGLVSAEEDRTANRADVIAQSNVTLRRAQVGAGGAALTSSRLSVDEATRRLAETEITARIAGTVLSVAVERGSIVASGTTSVSGGTALATIADLTDLRVVGQIDEAQIGRVAVGQVVEIRVDAYPDRAFTGRVARVSPLGTEVSNVVTFDVEVIITDRDAQLLRSGMSADLEIETGRHEDVLLIPLNAIQTSAGRRTVRLTSGRRRPIRTGATDGTRIVVLSGLSEGDRILIGGTERRAPSSGGGPLPFSSRGGRR